MASSFITTADRIGGTDGTRSAGAGGRRAMWQCSHSSGSAAWKGSRPVSISKKITPSEYRSLRWSSARLVRPVCSGDMYGSEPSMRRTLPVLWRWLTSVVAMPKSVSFTAPVTGCTRMLSGLRSLWMTSCW